MSATSSWWNIVTISCGVPGPVMSMTAEPAETTRTVAIAGKLLPSDPLAVPSHSPASALIRSNSGFAFSAASVGVAAANAVRSAKHIAGLISVPPRRVPTTLVAVPLRRSVLVFGLARRSHQTADQGPILAGRSEPTHRTAVQRCGTGRIPRHGETAGAVLLETDPRRAVGGHVHAKVVCGALATRRESGASVERISLVESDDADGGRCAAVPDRQRRIVQRRAPERWLSLQRVEGFRDVRAPGLVLITRALGRKEAWTSRRKRRARRILARVVGDGDLTRLAGHDLWNCGLIHARCADHHRRTPSTSSVTRKREIRQPVCSGDPRRIEVPCFIEGDARHPPTDGLDICNPDRLPRRDFVAADGDVRPMAGRVAEVDGSFLAHDSVQPER